MLIEHAKSQFLLIDVQERLLPVMVDSAGILRQIGILLAAARHLSIPVLVSEQYPAGLGPTVPEIAEHIQPGEILAKTEFSCFANTALRQRLEAAPDHLILAGIESHVCVLQSALDLVAAGRRIFVVADAVSSRRADSKTVALQRLAAAGVTLVTTEMVLFEWLRRADRPEFRLLRRLIR
jgi:nicotinamidase-related amidase